VKYLILTGKQIMFNPPPKYWKIKDPGNPERVEKLSLELNIPRVISNLLVQRGLERPEEVQSFFQPRFSDLHDPFLMKDMKKAVLRIEEAINKNERILIYGDYDVDGTTSVAMMYLFLKNYHQNIDFYVPNRYNEGYGISLKGIDYAIAEKIPLVIVLDCGIKAAEKVKYAHDRGIDFIICDHHEPDNDIPKAVAVLDPKQTDCQYPFKELSGCGVGFKLMQAFSSHKNINPNELMPYLDLVCVSIASDIVPLTGENRILAFCGLEQLNNNPRTGLAAIIKEAKLEEKREKKEIAIDDIVFKIGPRINAAGRIESGKSSVELLISSSESDAKDKGDIINTYNIERKVKDLQITTEALKQIADNKDLIYKKTTVLYNPKWSKGVIGIVASRLIETYYRPTIVLTESNGFITGSARSVPGFDLYQALEKCSDLLETFGGHMYAAGLTLKKDVLKNFQYRFEEVVSETIEPEMLIPRIEIDAELKLKEVDWNLYSLLKKFQPFGPGNMTPVFFTKNVTDNGSGRAVGNGKDHLKLNLISEDTPYNKIPSIAFGLGYMYDKIELGLPFDICYCIDENTYLGKTTIQLRVKDIQFDGASK
jgi:single-stranded-DNA-specific exonuclease